MRVTLLKSGYLQVTHSAVCYNVGYTDGEITICVPVVMMRVQGTPSAGNDDVEVVCG